MTLSRRAAGDPDFHTSIPYVPTSTEHKENIDFQLNEFLDISFQSQGLDSGLTRTAFKS